MGAVLGLLGIGGGQSGSYGNSNTAGPATTGAITVNAGGGSNVVLYVVIGVIGFLGLIFLLRR